MPTALCLSQMRDDGRESIEHDARRQLDEQLPDEAPPLDRKSSSATWSRFCPGCCRGTRFSPRRKSIASRCRSFTQSARTATRNVNGVRITRIVVGRYPGGCETSTKSRSAEFFCTLRGWTSHPICTLRRPLCTLRRPRARRQPRADMAGRSPPSRDRRGPRVGVRARLPDRDHPPAPGRGTTGRRSRCHASIPPRSGRARRTPSLWSLSATRALVTSLGQVQ